MKVSDVAGVQLMLCSHFFSSVLIKTSHFPEDKLVRFFGIKCQQHQANCIQIQVP